MAKYYGKIGFSLTEETKPGVWTESIIERDYFGDVLQDTRRWQSSDKRNDDLEISNKLSIISDPFISVNMHTIKYVTWMNSKWKVSSIDVAYPRLNLTIGGVYTDES